MKLDDITLVTVATAARNIRLPENLLNQVMYEAYVAIKQADNLEVYMEGSHKLLSYPEFQDVHKAGIPRHSQSGRDHRRLYDRTQGTVDPDRR